MIQKTQGIVLSHVPFKETSIVAKVYTREHGYHGLIVNSVRSAQSKTGMAFFQPFTFLDLVLYIKHGRELHRVSEFKMARNFSPPSIQHQTVLLFLSEVLEKILRNESAENPEFFDHISMGIELFLNNIFLPNFHIQFLLKISPYLGIDIESGDALYRNMNRVSDQNDVNLLIESLLSSEFTDPIESKGHVRTQTLEVLVHYLQHHFDGFGKVRSLPVLTKIFS